MPTLTPVQARAGTPLPGRTAMLTVALALLSFSLPLATDMYLPAFPQLAEELNTDASSVQLTLTSFLLGMACGQLVLGPVSDRFGRRTPILVGTGICALATAACALAPSVGWLVVLRLIVGFTCAAGLVVGRAMVADMASGRAAAKIFGILMALTGIAPIVAPLAGGLLVNLGGWRAVFWALAGVTAVMFLVALVAIPESLPPERRQPAGISATVRAVSSVVADRIYLGYTLAFVFASGALFSYIAGSMFLYQTVLGMSVGTASIVFACGALAATLSSAANTKLVNRFAPRRLLQLGLTVMLAATSGLLIVTVTGQLGRASAVGLLLATFSGLGLVFANGTALALDQVPHAAGTGSALLGALQSGLGAAVAPLMGVAGAASAVPLAVGMAGSCALGMLALLLVDVGRRSP